MAKVGWLWWQKGMGTGGESLEVCCLSAGGEGSGCCLSCPEGAKCLGMGAVSAGRRESQRQAFASLQGKEKELSTRAVALWGSACLRGPWLEAQQSRAVMSSKCGPGC